MPHIYRRPFDYAIQRQRFADWHIARVLECTPATSTWTTYQATITSGGAVGTYGSQQFRDSQYWIYRRPFRYSHVHSRVNLFYTDAQEIFATTAQGTWTTYAARVQLGSTAATTIACTTDEATYTTYPATITGGRRDPLVDAVGEYTTYAATLTVTYGLGESRVGQVPAKGTANYTPARLNVKGRSGRKRSSLHELVKRK